MTQAVPLTEIWRGPRPESVHLGHAVICDASGDIKAAWGNPSETVLARSSAKMIQALPLITSGAADASRLTPEHLALACASHEGTPAHADRVRDWVATLDLDDADFRCGAHDPLARSADVALIREGTPPCQRHNQCSGKHAGFLTLNRQLGGNPDYVDPDHAVQTSVLAAFEEVTGETSPFHAIDGCSAPNFASSLMGMARAMAWFATASETGPVSERAAVRLWQAMVAHPDLVAGEGRACTELMRACSEPVALKTGAEGFFVAILPQRGLGIALKVVDGGTRGASCAITSLLVRLGALDAEHPAARKFRNAPIRNWRGIDTGMIKPAAALA
ncbi:MAG: asparaginase [Roseovarius sp.]